MPTTKRIQSPTATKEGAEKMAHLPHRAMKELGTVDGVIDEIRTRKNVAPQTALRKMAFKLGLLPEIKPTARNIVVLGCFAPFISPDILKSYFSVLRKYGVDFTALDDEVCCGWIALENAVNAEDWEGLKRAEAAAKGFMKENVDVAIGKSAENLLHVCEWCIHAYNWAKDEGAFGEEGRNIRQMSYLGPIFERMDKVKLRMKEPTVIGYYQGCYRRAGSVFPKVKIDWSPYRKTLDTIENARVVSLPGKCCITDAEGVIEDAKKRGVDAIVARCYPCWFHLTNASKGTMPIKFFPDILDEASA